ncbi:MAG: YdcF family protein [Acidimicrobiales bacterium]
MALLGGFMVVRLLRWIIRLVVLAVLAAAVYLVVSGVQVWLASRVSEPVHSQAIIIMGAPETAGAPSATLAARLREAGDLWHQGLAPLIVASGAQQPGTHHAESTVEAAWLAQAGVPPADVVQVGGSAPSGELSDAAGVLHARGDPGVLLVTGGIEEKLAEAIAGADGLHPSPVPASSVPVKALPDLGAIAKQGLAVGLGRIVGYRHLSWFGFVLGGAR